MPEQSSEDARVRIFIEDHTGNKQREARIAAKASVKDLVPALISAMKLPATDPSGRPVTYHVAFNDRQLQEGETLTEAGVADGSVITVVPEMTAG